MRRSPSAKIERAGVTEAMKAFEQVLGWVFREQATQDYGIDAHAELVDGEMVSGRLLGLQIKSGESWFREPASSGWWFRPDPGHVTYWLNHSLPVAVVLYHPGLERCFWQLVSKRTLKRTSGGGWKLLVPESQVLDERSAAGLRESVEIDPLLRLRPLAFRGVVAEVAQGFHGREWLFADISRWRERTTRSLLILGDPGVGKSAIAAKLVLDDSRVVAHFFCRYDEAVTLLPGRLVHTLAAQLAAAFPAYKTRLEDRRVRELLDDAERDPVTALTRGVFGPLGESNPLSETRYLVVDGLDEALACAESLNIVRVLAAVLARLPRWLRLIATARNEAGVTDRLRELQFYRIDPSTPDSKADLRTFVAARMAAGPAATGHHIDTLCAKSAGNFLYAVQTLQDIEAGHLRLAELEQLPPGLGGRYLAFFERHFPDGAGFTSAQRLLDVIVAAAEPLRTAQLAEATELDQDEELPRLGRYLRPYLKDQPDWGHNPALAFYHKSLGDWLTAPERRGAVYTANPCRGHTALAGWLLGHYRRGRAHWPEYLVRHFPMHLHCSERWDDLAAVLCDPNYLEARVESGEVTGLVTALAMANGPDGLPVDHPARSLLPRIEEAVRRDMSFIARHPRTLFQCLWNSCWWYDSAEAADHYTPPPDGWGADGPPWHRPTLAPWMQSWRDAKERAGPFVWVRSVRPPPVPLGGALRTICSGHNGAVQAVAFSPDGRLLASGARDGDLRLWNCDTGQEAVCFTAHERGVDALCWSPDGELLATGGLDDIDAEDQWTATVRVWDREGREVACLNGHRRSVTDLSWSSDGALLASAADWDTVRLWSARDHFRQVARLRRNKLSDVSGLHWSPDGHMLACGLWEAGTVFVWDRQGHNLATIRGSAPGVCVEALSWSPDSRLLASSWPDDQGGCIRLWDGDARREGTCLPGPVDLVSWSPDSRLLATTSLPSLTSGGLVRLWDVSGRELASMSGHDAGVTTLAWSPDSRLLASAGSDNQIWIWDPINGRPLNCLQGHGARVDTLSWSPDSQLLASGSDDHTVRIWRCANRRQLASLGRHKADVMMLAWSPEGQLLASGSKDGTIRLWDADGGERGSLRGHQSTVFALSWSPDGQLLASGSTDETVRLWDREGRALVCLGEVKSERGYSSTDFQVSWSPDGRMLASVSTGSNAIRLCTREGQEITHLHGHTGNVHALQWSPDGSLLASGSNDRTIRLWDASGRELRRIHVRNHDVHKLSWSPDGRLLACIAGPLHKDTVQIWDTENGILLADLPVREGTYVRSLAWTDDGRSLLIVDSAAGVINLPVGDGPSQNAKDRQTDGWLVDNRGGSLAFMPPGRQKPVAWFPVRGWPKAGGGRSWACRVGAEVYLLRLEGVKSTTPTDS